MCMVGVFAQRVLQLDARFTETSIVEVCLRACNVWIVEVLLNIRRCGCCRKINGWDGNGRKNSGKYGSTNWHYLSTPGARGQFPG